MGDLAAELVTSLADRELAADTLTVRDFSVGEGEQVDALGDAPVLGEGLGEPRGTAVTARRPHEVVGPTAPVDSDPATRSKSAQHSRTRSSLTR